MCEKKENASERRVSLPNAFWRSELDFECFPPMLIQLEKRNSAMHHNDLNQQNALNHYVH